MIKRESDVSPTSTIRHGLRSLAAPNKDLHPGRSRTTYTAVLRNIFLTLPPPTASVSNAARAQTSTILGPFVCNVRHRGGAS
jgi:hypothetical protein